MLDASDLLEFIYYQYCYKEMSFYCGIVMYFYKVGEPTKVFGKRMNALYDVEYF